jgi:hypothetical protein
MAGMSDTAPLPDAAPAPLPEVTTLTGVTAVVWPPGVPLDDDGDAIIGAAWGTGATLVVVPADALPASFFDLSTGIAGALLQRLVNYRFRVAVVGDLAAHLAGSRALRDLVAESNRGQQVWFLPDDAALAARLARP